MARVTNVEVEELVEVDSDISLDPYILAANELVTELCTDSGYTDARLAMIEAWLAAHFYLMGREQAIAQERVGPISVSFQYEIGKNLSQTKQGQTAMMLDTAGNLASLSKQVEEGQPGSVSLGWLGKDYSTEDPDD